MDQSRTSVPRPQSWRMFYGLCYSPLHLNVWAKLNPTTEPIRPSVLERHFRKISVFNSSHATILTIDNRANGFHPSVDQWPQRDFISLPNRPGVVEFD